MARTAKAQLYQMGSVSSQLVLAGADESPEAVMLQRLRGLLEQLRTYLATLMEDLKGRVADHSPQLQWRHVYEAGCQLTEASALAAGAWSLPPAAIELQSPLLHPFLLVGMRLTLGSSPLSPAQQSALVVRQLELVRALLLSAEARGILDRWPGPGDPQVLRAWLEMLWNCVLLRYGELAPFQHSSGVPVLVRSS
ncbi:hypothetical protein COHA_000651 [Chlorella ohadii]|uniref:Uncharacterized protein n=1 Tax=Chlorella ohadii TaxID=2649997 RepID=A0AAD5H9D2_9CHLO|nr:hypothetical protein COHA_000651 [Chlorella ohadii]